MQQTLEECTACIGLRHDLIVAIGRSNLSLPAVDQSMVESGTALDRVASCEDIMSAKEAAGRERESASPLHSRKRRSVRSKRDTKRSAI